MPTRLQTHVPMPWASGGADFESAATPARARCSRGWLRRRRMLVMGVWARGVWTPSKPPVRRRAAPAAGRVELGGPRGRTGFLVVGGSAGGWGCPVSGGHRVRPGAMGVAAGPPLGAPTSSRLPPARARCPRGWLRDDRAPLVGRIGLTATERPLRGARRINSPVAACSPDAARRNPGLPSATACAFALPPGVGFRLRLIRVLFGRSGEASRRCPTRITSTRTCRSWISAMTRQSPMRYFHQLPRSEPCRASPTARGSAASSM
jgi:hypothetical protein